MLADYALIDQQGKLSVLGLFQHVWVPQFPAVHPRTHLVLRVRGRRTEIGSHSLRIRFVDDQRNELLDGQGTVQFGEPPARSAWTPGRSTGYRLPLHSCSPVPLELPLTARRRVESL